MRKIWAKNRKLKEALTKAEESDKVKSAFIRNMGHEIRTPLNAINGFSQLLCSPSFEVTDSEKQEMKQRITDNVGVVTAIVNELLELSKGESQLPRTDVLITSVCRTAVGEAAARNHKNVTIDFTSHVADDLVISSDGDSIKRILDYLLDNALKFTREGTINLDCSREGHTLRLALTDTGIGVPEADRERIFDNFVKLSEFTEGVGLGLPVCRRLARQLGGDVVLDAGYHNGSRFVLTLPTK